MNQKQIDQLDRIEKRLERLEDLLLAQAARLSAAIANTEPMRRVTRKVVAMPRARI